jgi:biotin transport system permease protein
MLRAIPSTAEIADETKQAALARGLERSPRARLTPLVVRVVARARMTGEALHARGVLEE